MDKSQKENVREPSTQFPNWLEEIMPVDTAGGYLRARCPSSVHDDILNQVIMKLNSHYESGKPINRAYAFSALRSCVVDYHRRNKREPKTNQINEQTSISKIAKPFREPRELSDKMDRILAQLQSLSTRARVLIKLKHHHSYRFTYKELGDILGYSEATVRQEYKKYINIIRYKMEQDNCQDE